MKEVYILNDLKDSRIFFDKNPPEFMRWFIGIMVIVIMFLLIWSTFATKVEVVKVKGMVVSKDTTNISPDILGVIETVHFKEGDTVKKGDVIITLKSDNQDIQADVSKKQSDFLELKHEYYDKYEESIKTGNNLFSESKSEELEYYNNVEYYITQINNYNDQIGTTKNKIKEKEKVQTEFKNSIKEYNNKINEIDTNLVSYSQQIEYLQNEIKGINITTEPQREEELTSKQELLSKKELEKETLIQAKTTQESKITEENTKIDSENEQIEQLNESIESTEKSKEDLKIQMLAQVGQKRSDIELQKIEADGKYLTNSEYQNNYILKAASDGIIHFNYEVKEGTVIQAATPLAKVFDESGENLSLQVALPSNERSKVKKDNNVEIALDGILQTKFGVIEGRVSEINIDSSVDQESGETFFFTYVEPSKLNLVDKKGNIVDLKPGMSAEVRIKYEENTWMQWLLEQINVFI